MDKNALIEALFQAGAVTFGNFTLKSGIQSPIYLDLRVIISYPLLLAAVADAVYASVSDAEFELICGVPYTALPIATAISLKHQIPMVMRRKEVKDYGTKKAIEGVFKKGQTCLLIEDLITSGQSCLETIEPLKLEGLAVSDIAVLIDREQGGKERLTELGFDLHSVLNMTEVVDALCKNGSITSHKKKEVLSFIHETKAVQS